MTSVNATSPMPAERLAEHVSRLERRETNQLARIGHGDWILGPRRAGLEGARRRGRKLVACLTPPSLISSGDSLSLRRELRGFFATIYFVPFCKPSWPWSEPRGEGAGDHPLNIFSCQFFPACFMPRLSLKLPVSYSHWLLWFPQLPSGMLDFHENNGLHSSF